MTETLPAPATTQSTERRRPDRRDYNNPHLIATLRAPEAGVFIEPAPAPHTPSFAPVVLAAAALWGVVGLVAAALE